MFSPSDDCLGICGHFIEPLTGDIKNHERVKVWGMGLVLLDEWRSVNVRLEAASCREV